MNRLPGTLLLALILLASPAFAEDVDAETRFHDAYVQEVIDGEIADGAKAYLALVGDENVPTRIRDEARFRFAICTVLLGRPDEGRMQLAAIVANERTPANLRERAQAYLDSISTLGIGTELERKLQSLVFDLGRSQPSNMEVPAYRDFEIIGEPAIPFLEKLLQHRDVNLRRHAFRLLIRLGAEDLVERWTPEIGIWRDGFNQDLTNRYLATRPEELARLEAKLLVLDDQTLKRGLGRFLLRPSWSLDFVRALAVREALRPLAFGYLRQAGNRDERWAFAHTCILGEDESLRDAACDWALDQDEGPPDEMADVLWPVFLRRLAARKEGWSARSNLGSRSGNVEVWAKRVSTSLLLASLEELVTLGETWPEGERGSPLQDGLASLLTGVFAERPLETTELDTYEALVRRWIRAVAPTLLPLQPRVAAHMRPTPLRNLIERLPDERATAFVRWLFEGPAYERAGWFVDDLAIERLEDVDLLLEAVKAVDPDQREVLVGRLPRFRSSSPSEEIARAEVEALPAFLRLTSASKLDGPPGRGWRLASMVNLVGRIPDEVLSKALRSLFETAVEMEENTPKALFDRIVDFRSQTAEGLRRRTSFLVRFVLPAIDALIDARVLDLSVPFRRYVLQRALFPLRNQYGFEEGDRERLAAYVLRNQDDLKDTDLHVLASHPDLFPLEAWLPAAAANALTHQLPLRPAQVDPAMKALTADVSKINQAVLAVLVQFASAEVAKEVVDRMLASEDATIRHRAVGALHSVTGYPATPAGLETALASLLAEEPVDLADLARIALLLAKIQPSERLLPAAKLLLGSDEKKDRVQGILLADRLGREELVPALARLLDSLDADLRDRARQAIGAIREIRRFKEEAQQPR